MTVNTVIWDVGGVLLRTEDPRPRQGLADRLGVERSRLEQVVFGGESGSRAQLGEITYEQLGQSVQEALGLGAGEWDSFQEDFWGGDCIDEELVDYIRSLRRGAYRTGLLSNAFSNLRELMTSVWKITDAFDAMVISAEVGLVKPDPRIYHLALEQHQIAPEQAVFIDDMAANVEGARQVGMQSIQFHSPAQVRQELGRLLNGRTR